MERVGGEKGEGRRIGRGEEEERRRRGGRRGECMGREEEQRREKTREEERKKRRGNQQECSAVLPLPDGIHYNTLQHKILHLRSIPASAWRKPAT